MENEIVKDAHMGVDPAEPGHAKTVFTQINIDPKKKQMAALYRALAKAQGEFKNPTKNKEVDYGQGNKKVNYKYADLAACIDANRKVLSKFGLCVIQTMGYINKKYTLITKLLHEDGGFEESYAPLSDTKSCQAFGGDLTYFRRYAYCAIIGIASEDDDDGKRGQEAGQTVIQANPNCSDDKIKKLFTSAKKNGYTRESLSALIINKYDMDNFGDLNKTQYSKVFDFISNNHAPPVGPDPDPQSPEENGNSKSTGAQSKKSDLTKKQIERLYTIATSKAWTHQMVKDQMAAEYSVRSSKELTKIQYEELIKIIEKNDQNPPDDLDTTPLEDTAKETEENVNHSTGEINETEGPPPIDPDEPLPDLQ